MAEVRHWRRRLKNGSIQYFFDAGQGHTVWGAGWLNRDIDALIEAIAQRAGVEIPGPEWKRPLFVSSAQSGEADR
jgi:hypothetical protein